MNDPLKETRAKATGAKKAWDSAFLSIQDTTIDTSLSPPGYGESIDDYHHGILTVLDLVCSLTPKAVRNVSRGRNIVSRLSGKLINPYCL